MVESLKQEKAPPLLALEALSLASVDVVSISYKNGMIDRLNRTLHNFSHQFADCLTKAFRFARNGGNHLLLG